MTQTISRQTNSPFTSNYEEDNWDDIEFPETLVINNDDDYDYGLSTTTRDMSEMAIQDSSDEDSEEDYCFDNRNSSNSTPVSSPSSINRVKEIMINSVAITNNNEKFSGLITRIGGENNRVIAVGDDWDNDVEIPEDFANLKITTNKKNRSRSSTNNFEFESWDEEEEQSENVKSPITSPRELIIKRIEDPLKVLSKPSTAKSLESFDDDFDFSGVDLNKLDLSTGALKSHQELDEEKEGNLNNKDPFGSDRLSSRNSSRLSILPSPAPTNGSLGSGEEEDLFDDIQFPEHMDSLTLTNHNDDELTNYNDDDDFENGLDIGNESVFNLDHLKNKNIITRPNPTQQKRTRRESFSIEINNSPKDYSDSSTSAPLTDNKIHPENTRNTSSPISLHRLETNKVSSKSPTSSGTQVATTIAAATKNTSKSATKSSLNRSKSPQDHKHPLGGLVKKPIFMVNNTSERSGVTNVTSKQSSKKTASTSNKHVKSSPKTNQTISMPSDNKKSYQRNKQNANPNITHKNTVSNNTPNNTPNATPNAIPNAIPNVIPNVNSKTNTNTNSTLEIMRKPKGRQSFGDGTELDGFDDLPINVERERSHTSSSYTRYDRRNSVSSVGSKTDNSDNHYRKHKKTSKRKKPQLIRNLNIDKNPKAVGEMVYNPLTKRWDGNDSILKDFDNVLTSPIRPALISNMNNRITNAKSFQVVGKMKFDPIKMCWNNNSSDEDDDILARFDHDDDDSQNCFQAFSDISNNNACSTGNRFISLKKHSNHQPENVNPTSNNSNDFQVGSEFDITPGFLAALLASERQHRNEITRWYPDALSKKNDSRFGLRDVSLQRSYLYDLRNNNNRKNNSSNNSKTRHKNRSGGLFEAAKNLTRHERRHFCNS